MESEEWLLVERKASLGNFIVHDFRALKSDVCFEIGPHACDSEPESLV